MAVMINSGTIAAGLRPACTRNWAHACLILLVVSLSLGCDGTSEDDSSDPEARLTADVRLDPSINDTTLVVAEAIAREEPIRLLFKIHLEDLVGPCGTTTNDEELADANLCNGFSRNFTFVDTITDIATRRGIELSMHGNGDWWQQVMNNGLEPDIRDWLARGHQIGAHMHAAYEMPLELRDDAGTARCEDAAGEGIWCDAAAQTNQSCPSVDSEANRCQIWSDHDRLLRQLLPDVAVHQATPYRQGGRDVPALMETFGYSVLGGGERHEAFQEYFGHHAFQGWRIGIEENALGEPIALSEDPSGGVVIVHTHAQLDRPSVHGGCGGVFEDRTLDSMKLRFIEIYLNWLYAERTNDPRNIVWSFGFVVHGNQNQEWVDTDTGRLVTGEPLHEWLEWLDSEWVGQTSARGHTVAEWSNYQDVADSTNTWYDNNSGQTYFGASRPPSECWPENSASLSMLDVATCRSHYPYEFWGMAQTLAATEAQVVQYVGPDATFAARDVRCEELVYGPREPQASTACGTPIERDIVAGEEHQRFLCWKESDGDVSIDLAQLTPNRTNPVFVSINPRTGAAQTVTGGQLTIGVDPAIIQLSNAPLYPWQ